MRPVGPVAIVLLLASGAVAGEVASLTVPLRVDPEWSSGPANNTYCAAFGDLDLDGSIDLVCGNYEEENAAYYNQEGSIRTLPSWLSNAARKTTALCLGDVDGDGDLDLLCGNWQHANTLYRNEAGTLSSEPVWSSEDTSNTYGVALADMDGDGDLDLVCGNYNQPNSVYRNHGGSLATTPAWSSAHVGKTTCIVVGDVDNDGDLDLACGNFGESNTLYRNESGTLSSDPAWFSDSTKSTWTISLGDVDGDGWMDLLCGNTGDLSSAQRNTLYLNQGGVFSGSPDWFSTEAHSANGSALGDVDGDGDLDAAFGNVDRQNTVYLNSGGTLSAEADWSSNTDGRTYAVLFGDVDGDGDLDLACVNSGDFGAPGERNTLFLNEGDSIGRIPVWSTLATHLTRSAAIVDVNRDGYPDLVFGNDGQANELFLSEAGVLATDPTWSSSAAHHTYSVALGDVNGDGYPDLACGNPGENSTLHLYDAEGEGFSETPAWSSESGDATWSVALGDIDGDGDLDLVCGNHGQANKVYVNHGGALSDTVAWSSSLSEFTRHVALGDVDGDGDLDLVCGNGGLGGEKNTIYRNEGGEFSDQPTWLSGPANRTWGVALGDVDGDGDLDLVCANSNQNNTAYINEGGGSFSVSPFWSSVPTNATRSVAFGDVDGDRDLDVICGNYGQGSTIYFNDRGTLSAAPGWVTGAFNTGTIALGDTDRDGDLDLIFANYGQGNALFPGMGNPVFRGDPESPVNYLPNNAAFFDRLGVVRTEANLYQITLDVVDVESDPVWLLAEYGYSGSWATYPLGIGKANLVAGPLMSAPGGAQHQFQWDVSLLPFDRRSVVLNMRAVENPKSVPLVSYIPAFRLDVGPVIPTRSEMHASPEALTFPTVTAGDTVSAVLSIRNIGNATLAVSDVVIPSTEMVLTPSPPYSLEEGESLDVTVGLAPVVDLDASGELSFQSNDPLTPSYTVGVTADIRPLAVSSRLLTPEVIAEVFLGEALTVIVTPSPQVRVESGSLFYTVHGLEGGSFEIPLSPSENDFIAVIPGQHVTEAGLSYYLEVRNSPVVATDPPGAPEDSVFTIVTRSPDSLSSTALPNSGEGFLEGREIRVLVNLQEGAVLESGSLHVREGGERSYRSIALDTTTALPFATIPESLVGASGLEYWLEVTTLTNELTDPKTSPGTFPHSITVTVQDLEEDTFYAARQYRMVSVPLAFSQDFTGTIEALLSDQQEFGPYDPVKWRAFRYVADSLAYGELADEWASDHFRPEPGRAFWLVSSGSNRVDTSPVIGYSTPLGAPYRVDLAPGWNQVGNPFCFPVAWDSVLADTIAISEAEATLIEPPIAYEPGAGYQYDTEVLQPFGGYWIRNLTEGEVALWIPPVKAEAVAPAESAAVAGSPSGKRVGPVWMIRIGASGGEVGDRFNYAGVHPEARDAWDAHDRSEPPGLPGRSVSLYFPHASWGKRSGMYSVDVRGGSTGLEKSSLHEWRFDVAKNYSDEEGDGEVEILFGGVAGVPPEQEIRLVDTALRRMLDLRVVEVYRFPLGKKEFVSGEEEARFALLVGGEEMIRRRAEEISGAPAANGLYPNAPNPFNACTAIRYDVAEGGEVEIKVYDVRGALVKTLFEGDRGPGVHEIGWEGTNDSGESVPSGVYFYRMKTASGFEQTRKLVLIR